MSMNKRRGPRVAHGLARLMAAAQMLPSVAAAAQGPIAHPRGTPKSWTANPAAMAELDAMAGLTALMNRLRAAELRVKRVQHVVNELRSQFAAQPPGSPAVALAAAIVDNFEKALDLPETPHAPDAG